MTTLNTTQIETADHSNPMRVPGNKPSTASGHWFWKVAISMAVLSVSASVQAASQYYSGASSTKTWDTTSSVWASGSGGPYNAVWVAGNDAFFEGTAATITGTAAIVHNINFGVTGYTLNTTTITLSGTTPTVSFASGGIATIGSIIADSGNGLTVSGAGTLTITGANTYTGGTTIINSGNLTANFNSQYTTTPNVLGSGSVSIGSGSTLLINQNYTSGNQSIGNTFNGSGLLQLNFAAGTTSARTVTMKNYTGFTGTIELANGGSTKDKWDSGGTKAPNATVQIDNGSTMYVSSSTTLGNITVVGAGNAETYGAIRLGVNTTLTGPITLLGSATVGCGNAGSSPSTISGNITGAATSGTYTLTQGASNAKFGCILSGIISDGTAGGNVALTQTIGTLTLSGANTYSGGTAVNGGILTFLNTSAKPSSGTVTVGASGTLGLGVGGTGYFSSANVDSLFTGSLSGVSMNSGSGVAIDTSAGDFTYATSQTAARTLTKLGTHTLTLSGANSYTGTTTVSNGTLLVNGSTGPSSAVAVLANATLGGTGAINGTVTVANGGTIEPTLSGSAGTLTLASSTAPSFTATGTLKIRVPTTSTADKVTLSSTTPAFACGNLNLVIDTTGLNGNVSGATIVLVAKTSGGTTGTFANVTANNGYSATVHYNTQSITVDLTGSPFINGPATATVFTTTYGTASAAQSFPVSGYSLAANLVATAPTGYEVSSDGITYDSTANFIPSSGYVSGTLYIRLAATAPVAGTYNSQNITLTSSGATTVNIATSASGNKVSAKTLTVTATDVTKAYGMALTGGSGSTAFTSSGLQNSETIGSVTIAYGTGSAAIASVASSPYTGQVTPSAATGGTFTTGNYNITYATGKITVTPAALTITANAKNKTYGTTQSTPVTGSTAFTPTGLQNGETVGTVTLTYGNGGLLATSAADSTSTITPSAAVGGTFTAANYNINYNTGTLTVVKATPTFFGLTANSSISYGTATVSLSGTVSASLGYPADNETVSVTINNNIQSATIAGGTGGFTVTFPTTTIPPSPTAYTITYAFAGDGNLNAAANDTSTQLTVTGLKVPNLTFTNAPGIARVITTKDIMAAGLTSSAASPVYTITGVTTPSNGGATIKNDAGTALKYTNSPSFASASDSFSYTVSDGSTSASGTVTIYFASVSGPNLTPGTDGNNHPVISFHGIPGYSYHIQRATSLVDGGDWANFQAITVPSDGDGSDSWTDTSVSSGIYFYRLSYP